jgi:hypothetical protein
LQHNVSGLDDGPREALHPLSSLDPLCDFRLLHGAFAAAFSRAMTSRGAPAERGVG